MTAPRHSRFTASEPTNTFSLEEYLASKPDWMYHPGRHCRGVDTARFYGSDVMVELCLGCPVEAECREYAIDNDEYGVWGATSERRRDIIRRRRRT